MDSEFQRNWRYKTCFSQDIAYANNKDFSYETVLLKVLKNRAHKVTLNSQYDGYEKGLSSMLHKFYDKKAEIPQTAN